MIIITLSARVHLVLIRKQKRRTAVEIHFYLSAHGVRLSLVLRGLE